MRAFHSNYLVYCIFDETPIHEKQKYLLSAISSIFVIPFDQHTNIRFPIKLTRHTLVSVLSSIHFKAIYRLRQHQQQITPAASLVSLALSLNMHIEILPVFQCDFMREQKISAKSIFFGFDFFLAKNYNIGFSVKPMICMEKMWPHVALSV